MCPLTPPEIIDNLKYLVENALQPIRNRLGFPITINSGYRSPLVNKLVGGSATSQHCRGEAADCELSPRFLTDPEMGGIRDEIRSKFQEITGRPMRSDVSENFFLFTYVCMNLDELDVDQVIHEYGEEFGHPAWVHISTSKRQDKRQILMVGTYTNKKYIRPPLEEALLYGA